VHFRLVKEVLDLLMALLRPAFCFRSIGGVWEVTGTCTDGQKPYEELTQFPFQGEIVLIGLDFLIGLQFQPAVKLAAVGGGIGQAPLGRALANFQCKRNLKEVQFDPLLGNVLDLSSDGVQAVNQRAQDTSCPGRFGFGDFASYIPFELSIFPRNGVWDNETIERFWSL
jgi:hypothetical protein